MVAKLGAALEIGREVSRVDERQAQNRKKEGETARLRMNRD
jgi:hypothetical protein